MAGGNGRYKAQDFIDAIPGSGGIISTISKRVGCAWNTAKRYIVNYPTVAKVYCDECEAITDLAELTIIKAIKGGDTHTAKWYLTMKGRERGYAQTQRVEAKTEHSGEIKTEHVNSDQHNRAILTLAETLRAILPGQSPGGDSDVDTAE